MIKIFLLEDDIVMRQLLKTLFEMEGFCPVILSDINENSIYTQLNEDLPDLLILDVHLHKLNGIDILRKIRGNKDYQKMKILVTSGEYLDTEAQLAGADEFLLKPYMPSTLINWIHSNIDLNA